jgi:putative oxidoreductase
MFSCCEGEKVQSFDPSRSNFQELNMSLVKTLSSATAEPPLYGHAAFVLRVSLGAVLLAHGLLKLFVFGVAGTSGFFASVGLAPWLAYPVIGFEIAAGALIVLGLWVRPLAALSALLLLGTVYVHAPNGWLFSSANGAWEYPLYLAFTAVVVALSGEGAYALRLPVTRKRLLKTDTTAAA